MKWPTTLACFLLVCIFSSNTINAQTNPSAEQLQQFFENQKVEITWREGEVLLGTYYFLEVHFCPNGYGLYGSSVKKTVLGNEQRNSWQEFGTWKITTQDGLNGILYMATNGGQNFYPMYSNGDGNLYYGDTTIINRGMSTCY